MEDPSFKNESFLAMAERYVEENGSDALEKLIANKSKDYSLNHHAEEIKTTDTSVEAGTLTHNQVKCVRENLIWIEKTTTRMQIKEMVVPTKQEQVKHVAAAQSELSTNEKLKEKVHLADTGQQENPKQLKNADVAVHNSKLWCGTCNMWFPDEIVMAAHLKGREHLAKLQIPMSSMALAERYLEENGSDAQEKLITHKVYQMLLQQGAASSYHLILSKTH
ncbi:uncharacterized protein LOC132606451 [Lycium barbarum]|uniref:uncharacterized protein LOC132606451 n=1 Tax=Lycium barbarum TaxID=112863 RepID=UPI00293EA1B6|nr:uncharacterized protein LOC132606451 [Lycium barbarum]XP_060175948.1 uncharacterized protein LOC132606451 [Lycium barbarum]